jgi:Na+-driven multidrug efflux pump
MISSVIGDRQVKRFTEVTLTILLLLLLFSVGGVPIVLLSKSTLSWNRGEVEREGSELYKVAA